MPIKRRRIVEFTPTKFSSAADKEKFYAHFIRFVQRGFPERMFHEWFYTRLSNMFGHIAHYNRDVFYHTWFDTAEKQLAFLHNARRQGCYGLPAFTFCDVEREIQRWLASPPAQDIVGALERVIAKATRERELATLAALKQKYPEEA